MGSSQTSMVPVSLPATVQRCPAGPRSSTTVSARSGHHRRQGRDSPLSGSLAPPLSGEPEQETDYVEYGMNSSISMAYYIAPASVTLSLGGRYQYFKTNFEPDPNNSDMDHHFYGITAAATYSFKI